MKRPFVIIETPYAATASRSIDDNVRFLTMALRDSWDRGELPFASHGYFPLFLRESAPHERQAGIEAGYWFWERAKKIVFYLDWGMSPGMERAHERALELDMPVEFRMVGDA